MAGNKFYFLLFYITYLSFICSVFCVLYLKEGATCRNMRLNGKCIPLRNCDSANLINLYLDAGFNSNNSQIPEFPDICSYKYKEPIVCCTDCNAGQSSFHRKAVGPHGILTDVEGSVAQEQCYDYLKKLPYPCRGVGNVHIGFHENKTKACYDLEYSLTIKLGRKFTPNSRFAHMALLGYGNSSKRTAWLCGGSIINERYILTAAHCSTMKNLGEIKYAAVGLRKIGDVKDKSKIYDISKILIHAGYKESTKYNDIALLRTKKQIRFGVDVLPACLDTLKSHRKYAEVTSWKLLTEEEDKKTNPKDYCNGDLECLDALKDKKFAAEVALTKNLDDYRENNPIYQPMILTEFNTTMCESMFPERGFDEISQMCYGSRAGYNCENEMRSPLLISRFKCMQVIIGVPSYLKPCVKDSSAGIYTRVSHFVPWIEKNIWQRNKNHRRRARHQRKTKKPILSFLHTTPAHKTLGTMMAYD